MTDETAEYVRRVVAAAPPLSPAQADKLRILLTNGKDTR